MAKPGKPPVAAPLALPSAAPISPLPEVEPADYEAVRPGLFRRELLQTKQEHRAARNDASRDLKKRLSAEERQDIYHFIASNAEDEALLEERLQNHFVPQHSPGQLLGTRALLVSPLFQVRSKSQPRSEHLELTIGGTPTGSPIQYRGPELRQSDARVFLALLHMLRDLWAGTRASFEARELCTVLFGRYDGDSRRQLREHIYRLQRGLLVFERFSVQLVQTFLYPARGPWTVALDESIVQLFRVSPEVWLDIENRLALPDGLASWLYGYIESQTKLIPMELPKLIALCGSQASPKAFAEAMREALALLSARRVIDTGWSVNQDKVRWRKPRN